MLMDALRFFEQFGLAYLTLVLVGLSCAACGLLLILRRMVFLGVTVAELSAAGAGLAFWLVPVAGPVVGVELFEAWGPEALSTIFALMGVLLFAARLDTRRLTRESVIGVGYVAAAALALLFVSQSGEGLEKLKNLLAGSVVYASSGQLMVLAVVLSVLLTVQLLFRKEILFVSLDREMALSLGMRAHLWDALLFVTLGITISASLRVAGLLLVFAFLLLPGLCGLTFTDRLRPALWTALLVVVASCGVGFYLQHAWELPAGPTIILVLLSFFGLARLLRNRVALRRAYQGALGLGVAASVGGLAISGLALAGHPLSPRWGGAPAAEEATLPRLMELLESGTPLERRRAIDQLVEREGEKVAPILAGRLAQEAEQGVRLALIHALARLKDPAGVAPLGRILHDHDHDAAHADDHPGASEEERAQAALALGRIGEPAATGILEAALDDPSPAVREQVIEALGMVGDPHAVPFLEQAAHRRGNEELRLAAARALVQLGDIHGVELLVAILEDPFAPPFERFEAVEALHRVAGRSFGYHANQDSESEGNRRAVTEWRRWLASLQGRLPKPTNRRVE